MAISVEISITGVKELLNKLTASTQDSVLRNALTLGAINMVSWSKKNRLSGPRPQFLGVRTGRLRSSIASTPAEKSGNIYLSRIGTNVEYARIHEFGGHTGRGKGFTMPARPFLRPSLEDNGNQQKVLDLLTQGINEALKK